MEDVVVFTALGFEARAVLDALQGVEPLGPRRWRGYLGDGAAALVVQAGIGPDRAQWAAERAPAARLFLSCGCAGALAGGLHAGEVVVGDRILGLDASGCPVAEHEADGAAIAAWGALRGVPFRLGAVASSPVVLARARAKSRAGTAGALVVEMESAGIATAARARGIPCAVVKVVLDESGDEVEFGGADAIDAETGELRLARALATVLPRPVYWPTMIRLARQQRLAERRLRGFLGMLCSAGLDGLGLAPDRPLAPSYAG
jgi:adenosylhomocysteine nucleosidase